MADGQQALHHLASATGPTVLLQVAAAATRPDLLQQPATPQASHPSPWVNAALALGTMLALDEPVKDWSQSSWQGSFGHHLASAGNTLGEGYVFFPAVAGASLATLVLAGRSSYGLQRAFALAAGAMAGPINNEVIKQLVGRVRPSMSDDPLHFHPFSGDPSFPSGHVSLPFSIAGAIDATTGKQWLVIPWYAAGLLTAYARVQSNEHWLSDVVSSAVIASIVSRKVTHEALRRWGPGKRGEGDSGPEQTTPARSTSANLTLTPAGVIVTLRF